MLLADKNILKIYHNSSKERLSLTAAMRRIESEAVTEFDSPLGVCVDVIVQQ